MKTNNEAKGVKLAFLSAVMNGDMDRARQLKAQVNEHNPLKHFTISGKDGTYKLDGERFTKAEIEKHLQAQQSRFKLSGILIGAIDESRAILASVAGPGTWFILPDNGRGGQP